MTRLLLTLFLCVALQSSPLWADDPIRAIQIEGVTKGSTSAVHWGPDPERYSTWTNHSNRLIPVYTYGTAGAGEGIDLASYAGERSLYRDAARVTRLYQASAEGSVFPTAEYLDQTDIYRLQLAALQAGRKHIFLVVFDGMDWQTTRAAAIWNSKQVSYSEGRGQGTHFQEYTAGGTTQFGYMVTSPARDGVQLDVDKQLVKNPGSGLSGGYHLLLGGNAPWVNPAEVRYMLAGPEGAPLRHSYTDSAASATSLNSGIKTYNKAINVDLYGRQQVTIAHQAQAKGYRVGAVTSVDFGDATHSCTYAHNVSRDDCQDISRDMLGLPSVSHPEQPLPGMDVVIGCGHGIELQVDKAQGENFVPGNQFLAGADLNRIDVRNGGKYVVSQRSAGVVAETALLAAADLAAETGKRLLGFFGLPNEEKYQGGHLPFASADGDYQPAPGVDGKPIVYTAADLEENPTLSVMTEAALRVLSVDSQPFWLMVESGDVDWANHSNNLDASIGAVNSGDAAVKVITNWVEQHSNWDESLLIVTADHGHFLVIDRPELLTGKQ